MVVVLIMMGMFLFGMLPAMATNDPVKIQQAADQTSEKILKFGTDRIVDEAKGLPFKIVSDELLK